MLLRFLTLLVALLSFSPVLAKPLKLSVQEQVSSFAPSNIGIIGIKYLHRPGDLSTIIEVFPNTPAQHAGIQTGDKLISVDGIDVLPFSSDQVFAMIAGRPGQAINLKLMRCRSGLVRFNCHTYSVNLVRADMNHLQDDYIYRIYRYGN